MKVDILSSCSMINNNVGRRVVMVIQKYGSNQKKQIVGTIKSSFSDDPTPDCRIYTTLGCVEVLLGEVKEIELLSGYNGIIVCSTGGFSPVFL